MTITFENDTDVIVYALEKIISFARTNQHIFLAQSIWWISSIIGLQSEVVIYIHNLRKWAEVPFRDPEPINTNCSIRDISSTPRDIQEESRPCPILCQTNNSKPRDTENSDTEHQNRVLQECDEFLWNSWRQWRIALLKASGITKASRNRFSKATKKANRIPNQLSRGIKN